MVFSGANKAMLIGQQVPSTYEFAVPSEERETWTTVEKRIHQSAKSALAVDDALELVQT